MAEHFLIEVFLVRENDQFVIGITEQLFDLTLNICFLPFSSVSFVDLKQVCWLGNLCWLEMSTKRYFGFSSKVWWPWASHRNFVLGWSKTQNIFFMVNMFLWSWPKLKRLVIVVVSNSNMSTTFYFWFAFENDFSYMMKKFYKQNLPKMSPWKLAHFFHRYNLSCEDLFIVNSKDTRSLCWMFQIQQSQQ